METVKEHKGVRYVEQVVSSTGRAVYWVNGQRKNTEERAIAFIEDVFFSGPDPVDVTTLEFK